MPNKKSLITKKIIEIELKFYGSGRVEQLQPGAFAGGVPDPKVGNNVTFTVHREVLDEDGIANPEDGEDTFEGSFQINVYGNSAGYRELGRYLLALAELDTTADEGFHQHHSGVTSADGRTQLHIILRKQAKTRMSRLTR